MLYESWMPNRMVMGFPRVGIGFTKNIKHRENEDVLKEDFVPDRFDRLNT